MKLDMTVGLGAGHIALDGDPALPFTKGHSRQFSAGICCGQMAGWIKMQLGREVGLVPSDIVLDGDPAPPLEKRRDSPQFLAHVYCGETAEYNLLSLSYKVLTSTQPTYLHNLISVQPPRSTRSSSLVTLARPPTSPSLRITDRSFRYASSCLWNQRPSALRQPYSSLFVSDLHVPAPTS